MKADLGNSQSRFNDEEEKSADEENHTFVPPRSWTAWPVEADDVPREGEQIGPEDEDEVYTLRRREREKPSRELEEILMGLSLKFAKEKFNAREEDDSGDDVKDEKIGTKVEPIGVSEDASNDEQEEVIIPKEASEPPASKVVLKPVVSADDDRSRILLLPSIRHTLSRLDDILIALHHARKTCRQYASDSEPDTDAESKSKSRSRSLANSEVNLSEATSDDDTHSSKSKRLPGRPRKHAPLPGRPRVDPSNIQEGNDPEFWRTKKTKRGRPKIHYEILEGETQQEYLIRIARLQKKPLPSFAPPLESKTKSLSPNKEPKKSRTKKEPEEKRKHPFRLRDWSEVLGCAALVGFPPEVIARATQRCANLFGESMIMRTLVEAPASMADMDEVAEYRPEPIPDFGTENETEISSNSSSSSESSSEEYHKPIRGPSKKSPGERAKPTIFHFCPIPECARNLKSFTTIKLLKFHLKKEHQMTKEEIENVFIDSDEEMEGAVHRDGWLKAVNGKRGWRGRDNREKKKGRRDKDGGNEQSVGGEEGSSTESETGSDEDPEGKDESYGSI